MEKGGFALQLQKALSEAQEDPARRPATWPPRVWFSDEMRVGLLGQVRRVWAPVGEKTEQVLQITYRWSYLVLAVEPQSGQLRWAWTANMKGASLGPIVANWKKQGVDVVVWDGAPGHRGPEARASGVVLVPLPPYSPELDPAERIFRELRRDLEGEVYADLQAKQARVEQLLGELASKPTRVRSLTAWDWLLEQLREGTQSPEESKRREGTSGSCPLGFGITPCKAPLPFVSQRPWQARVSRLPRLEQRSG